MLKALKTQVYPTQEQAQYLQRAAGSCRYIYNWALGLKKEAYETNKTNIGLYELMRRLTQLKKDPDKKWLNDIDSHALQEALKNLDAAYQKFFREQSGFPRFHAKHRDTPSFTANISMAIPSRHSIKIPKLKAPLKTKEKLNKKIKPRRITISERAGKWFVSILYESGASEWGIRGESVGIDVGIKDFAVLSDRTKIPNPKTYRKWEGKLAHEQRKLAKKKKGSKRRERQRLRVARLHFKVARIREDFQHKVSTAITKRYGYIALENLNVAGMVKNHHLAKSIAEIGRASCRERVCRRV
jgi:putative transposase